MSKFYKNQWMKEAKAYPSQKNKSYEKPPCIFSTSKALLKESEDSYVPQIVSIGPYHFGKKQLRGMETFKGDAARREVLRIQYGTQKSDIEFKQVIERIKRRHEDIKRCYYKETSLTDEMLHLMVARDACFILEFFRNHLFGLEDDESFRDEFLFLPEHHPIFGPISENPGIKSEIMKDLIKLDNQIPLFVLEDVLAMEMNDNSQESAKEKLDKLLRKMFDKICYRPFEFCAEGVSRKRNHILDIYHYSCLGALPTDNEKESVKIIVQYCSCFEGSRDGQCVCFGRASDGKSCESNVKQGKKWWLKIPSAVQLRNGGVIFQADGKTVDDVKYERKTLTLVRLKLDADSEVYIRNLVALEICSPGYKTKRMTAYCHFLHELCQTDKGVDVMRRKGVIIGNLWPSKLVTRLLSVSNLTISQPQCKSIKETREELSSYKTRRSIIYRSLWNEFWKAYGSKPWLVVGGFGATLVLFLTAVQVFCLFKHCGPR